MISPVTSLPPPDPAALVHDRFSAVVASVAVAGGSPTVEETVAIMAAIEHLWPRPVLVVDEPTRETPTWRFSGRWWSRPTVTRRDRPWVR